MPWIDADALKEKYADQLSVQRVFGYDAGFVAGIRAALEMPTLTLPNEPLTPKQLREMNEPVWCSCKPIEGGNGYWCLCRYGKIVTPSGNIFDVDKIPHWMFYRRPPEGEADA